MLASPLRVFHNFPPVTGTKTPHSVEWHNGERSKRTSNTQKKAEATEKRNERKGIQSGGGGFKSVLASSSFFNRKASTLLSLARLRGENTISPLTDIIPIWSTKIAQFVTLQKHRVQAQFAHSLRHTPPARFKNVFRFFFFLFFSFRLLPVVGNVGQRLL